MSSLAGEHLVHVGAALGQRLGGAEHRAIVLHGLLHVGAQLRGRRAAVGVARLVEAGDRRPRPRCVSCLCVSPGFICSATRLAAERPNTTSSSSELEPRRLAPCTPSEAASPIAIRPGTDGERIAVLHRHDLAVIVRRDAAHVVVAGRQDRDRLARDVDAGEDARGLGDAGQALVDHLGVEMLDVQLDVILVRAAAAAFADLDGHRAADDVARGEILGRRRIALHEALAAADW